MEGGCDDCGLWRSCPRRRGLDRRPRAVAFCPCRTTPQGKRPAAANSKVLARFSAMGTIAVALIVASGAANAGFRVGGAFSRLFDTAYGDVLCAKLAFVALMLALAYFNRFVAMPRLATACLKEMTKIVMLRASIATEIGLGLWFSAWPQRWGSRPRRNKRRVVGGLAAVRFVQNRISLR